MTDPDITSAPGDKLLFENDRVRVWAMTLAGDGGMYDFHQHHHDHVVIWPDAGTAQAQQLGDDDWGLTQQAEPGFVLFKTVGTGEPLTPHRIRNAGPATVTHYIVELLEPSPSAEQRDWQWNENGRILGLGE
ncbi:hypothetical protein Ade02nite_16740 [Paractinoplanes deccanensis]|uniref:Cupin n=1 Tax=Paractinoplanes deccanensis TaxID=113561 RepID=A0ABQ3XZ52_9ACTN|nr:hypothetical protein [Actinoplanes deccanensis]GID73033.1 hypothetical protein Ade02nite_16740 [Actinoplanes deccanensis]